MKACLAKGVIGPYRDGQYNPKDKSRADFINALDFILLFATAPIGAYILGLATMPFVICAAIGASCAAFLNVVGILCSDETTLSTKQPSLTEQTISKPLGSCLII